MNERNPLTYYLIIAGVALIFLLSVYAPVDYFLKSRARGNASTAVLIYSIPFQLFFLLCSLVVINYYYSQIHSSFDNQGVHWNTFLSKRTILWNQVVSVNLLNLRGGEKGLLIKSNNDSFKIELAFVGDTQQLIKFVEKETHRKITGTGNTIDITGGLNIELVVAPIPH